MVGTKVEIPLEGLGYLPYWRIKARPSQVRKTYKPGELEDLAASIKEGREYGWGRGTGLLHPLVVRWQAGAFDAQGNLKPDAIAWIVAGHSRFLAAGMSGIDPDALVPVSVETMNDAVARIAALHENIHRNSVHPLEVAEELQEIKNANKWTQAQLASHVKKPASWVQDHLDLLKAGEDVLDLLNADPDAMQVIRRLNTVKQPVLRGLFIRMRKGGASSPLLYALIPIKAAPQPLLGILITWLAAQWEGAQNRREVLTVDMIMPALRAEAKEYGYQMQKGAKAFEWVPIPAQPAPPVLNEEGEKTGIANPGYVPPAAPTQPKKPKPGEEKTITLPRTNIELGSAAVRRQVADLTDAAQPATTIPQAEKIKEHIRTILAAVQDLSAMVDARAH